MMSNPLNAQTGPTDQTCQTCVWHFVGGRGRPVSRCRRFGSQRLDPEWPSCQSYTETLDCLQCGACCREAYHAVEVGPRDDFTRKHPDKVIPVDGRLNIIRQDGICGCLAPQNGCWSCSIYDDRPKTCRDFELAGANCVDARVRMGITP